MKTILFILISVNCHFLFAQDSTEEETKYLYIKDSSGVIHHYDNIKSRMNKYYCYNDKKLTIYKAGQIISGCKGMSGGQFVVGKIKKQNGKKIMVKGRSFFKVLVYDNGNMILSRETTNSTSNSPLSYAPYQTTTATTTTYYIVQNNEVRQVPVLSKNIIGWENIFKTCPKHEVLLEQFNSREKGDYWSVNELVMLMSMYYYKECFVEF